MASLQTIPALGEPAVDLPPGLAALRVAARRARSPAAPLAHGRGRPVGRGGQVEMASGRVFSGRLDFRKATSSGQFQARRSLRGRGPVGPKSRVHAKARSREVLLSEGQFLQHLVDFRLNR
jgi:hypothetical protein